MRVRIFLILFYVIAFADIWVEITFGSEHSNVNANQHRGRYMNYIIIIIINNNNNDNGDDDNG